MTETYRPGAWHAILIAEGGRTHAAAALAPEVSESTVLAIWQALQGGGGFAGVLETLTSGYGVSLAALPDFEQAGKASVAPNARAMKVRRLATLDRELRQKERSERGEERKVDNGFMNLSGGLRG